MKIVHLLRQAWLGLTSRDTTSYWDRRYRAGMDSGSGSRGELALFKAKVLNELVARESIETVIELGCGDGQQLALAQYPKYLGLDVSRRAVDLCLSRFGGDSHKSFLWYSPRHFKGLENFVKADLTLSLDVIYHLLEDRVYESYLGDLFGLSRRWVVIYSSDHENGWSAPHVRHHKFTEDVARRFPEFRLHTKIENPYSDQTFADFYIFRRN